MSTDSHDLGRLTFVSASEAVGREDAAFTPWLAEHIAELGDVIGVPLALGDEDAELAELLKSQTEVPVGQYFLDIRALTDDGRIAAIENQYGTSDHKHLGQVLTYSAGVEADIVIWIAEDFTDPHLETLRWLNRRTDEECGIWAVRIRFVRIGDSPVAPTFGVAVAPSATARAARKSSSKTAHWTMPEFLEAIEDSGERAIVEDLVAKVEQTGDNTIWCGKKPTGQINFHPRNFHEGPFALWIKDGQVRIYGLWNRWVRFSRHEAYALVAEVLGQTLDGSVKSVALADIDVDALWEASLACVDELIALEPAAD